MCCQHSTHLWMISESFNDNEDVTINPKVAAVIIDDYIARRDDKMSVAGLVIGLTFVAAFLSIAVGLVGHGMIKKCRKPDTSGRSSRNSWMRSPGDDFDRTPPELRPGSNSGHPAYSDSSRRNSSRTRHLPGTLPGHSVSWQFKKSAIFLTRTEKKENFWKLFPSNLIIYDFRKAWFREMIFYQQKIILFCVAKENWNKSNKDSTI